MDTTTTGNGNGAASFKDLYKQTGDPAAEAAHLRGEARKLGLAFFVFFSLIIGGLSVGLTARRQGVVASFAAPAGTKVDAVALTAAEVEQWLVRWSGDQATQVELIDLESTTADDPDERAVQGLTRVRLRVIDAAGGRRDLGAVYVATVPGQRVVAVQAGAVTAPIAPKLLNALRSAKLLGLVPTHGVISLGALMGLLGALVPALLVPFYRFWMGYVAAPLGWFNTRVILAVVFFLLFTPMSIGLWLKRKLLGGDDPLLRAPRAGGTYWRRRERTRGREHFERTF
jgi:hypothetical protein